MRGQNRHFCHLARSQWLCSCGPILGWFWAMLVFKIPLRIYNVERIVQRLRYKQCLLSMLNYYQYPWNYPNTQRSIWWIFIYGDHLDLLIYRLSIKLESWDPPSNTQFYYLFMRSIIYCTSFFFFFNTIYCTSYCIE